MPCRLVLDTNVVLDLFHFADAAAQPILAALEAGDAECWLEDAGREELARVLTYPELRLESAAAAVILDRYDRLARRAVPDGRPLPRLPRCKDADDQKFLELVARIDAGLLVSKDRALLALARSPGIGFQILTPAAASALLTSKPLSGRSCPCTPASRPGQ